MPLPEAKDWQFNVDKYINSYVPRNFTHLLPKPISHFLGHRDKPRRQIGNLLIAAWAFLGAFLGVIVIEAAFMIPAIHDRGVPLLIASFGAAAVLEYNAIESPLAQPRNATIGHILAALVGIGVTKLFSLNSDFENLRWLAGAVACGLASGLMTVTKTVYPPAGATALLAAVDPQVERLGWYLLPLVALSSALTLVVSLLINNIQRQYPTYWWTPADLGKDRKADDIEKVVSHQAFGQDSQDSLRKEKTFYGNDEEFMIKVTPHHIMVPDHLYLAQEERGILEILRDRLREELPGPSEPAAQLLTSDSAPDHTTSLIDKPSMETSPIDCSDGYTSFRTEIDISRPMESAQVLFSRRMYDARSGSYDWSWHPTHAAKYIQCTQPQAGQHILDLASGTGLVSLVLKQAVGPTGTVMGVDISTGMTDMAKKKAEKERPDNRVAGLRNDYDLITWPTALALLRDPAKAIVQWASLLKPGGRIITDVPTERTQVDGLVFEKAGRHLGNEVPFSRSWVTGPDSLKKLCEEAGLHNESAWRAEGYDGGTAYGADTVEERFDGLVGRIVWPDLEKAEVREKSRKAFVERFKARRNDDWVIREEDDFYLVIRRMF